MGLLLEIKVIPNSGRSTFHLDESGKLKAYLLSVPEGGKANKELVKLLAKMLGCSQWAIKIVMGATARTKKISIDLPLTHDEVIHKLGFAVQTKIVP